MLTKQSLKIALGAREQVTSDAGQAGVAFAMADATTGSGALAIGATINFSDASRARPMISADTKWGSQIQALAVIPGSGWDALTPTEQRQILAAFNVRVNGSKGQVIDVPLAKVFRESQSNVVNAAATGYVGAQSWPFDTVNLPYPVNNDGSTAIANVQLVCDLAITPAADVALTAVLAGMFTPPQGGINVGVAKC